MSIYDRWHKSRPDPGEEKCRQHKMVPSSAHGQGYRWQVRWRDENGKQCKQNFVKKEGKDPELHADAFNAKVNSSLDEGTYVDLATGNLTFQEYAETWRAARTHDVTTGIGVEYNFRLHVYPSRETPGRTATGGPAIGHHKLRALAKQPSLVQAWIAGMRLGDSTKLGIIGYVSSVLDAAVDDGLITRNPLHARSITRPVPDKHEAIPLTLNQVEALTEALRHTKDCSEDCDNCGADRYEVIPQLGAGTGMRQGEMFAIDAETDIDFLRRIIHVRRQVKIIRGKQVFAPIKNDKTHDVPITELLCTLLARYMQVFPPVKVTLPWKEADGKNPEFKTFTVLLSRPGGKAMHRKMANDRWKIALRRAEIPDDRWHMMHVLRHTAVSAWLSAGISARAVAEFIGDTEETVMGTYSHMMPDDRDRARKAMERFFSRPEGSPASASAHHDVP